MLHIKPYLCSNAIKLFTEISILHISMTPDCSIFACNLLSSLHAAPQLRYIVYHKNCTILFLQ